jgi:hypothetical protein
MISPWSRPGRSGLIVGSALLVALVAVVPRIGLKRSSGAKTPGPAIAAPPAAPGAVPLYSDGWFDDSGFAVAKEFEAAVADPRELGQVGDARRGRGERGIAQLERMAAKLSARRSPQEAVQLARTHLMMGGLHMFDGRFPEARSRFEQARDVYPRDDDHFKTNIEALLGVVSLRRGETENCIACCNAWSCLFPLAPEAVHQQQEGSRRAIEHFEAYLRQRPEDLGVRWLRNVAAMTLGEYPEKVPAEYLLPLEPFRSRIDVGRFPNIAAEAGLQARGDQWAGACIVDDFTGDGRLDVVTTNLDPDAGATLFVNRGDGTFDPRSEGTGLEDQVGAANASHADIDNDGDLDLLLLRGGWERPKRMSLLRNGGDGTFVDVTERAGMTTPIASQSAAWADYNNDGLVDVYVCGESNPQRPEMNDRGRLYRNDGDGTFTDVATYAGVFNDRWAKGAAWGDYDNDGSIDLYVSNCGQPNRLYRNDGDGTFTDVAESLGVTEPLNSFSCWFWDYDNDGRLDLLVLSFGASLSDVVRSALGRETTGERPRLFHNEGPAGFRDVTKEAGLDRVMVAMGSNFGDLDNDGYLDFYAGTGRPEYRYVVPNLLFKNVDGLRFEDVTTASGTGHLQKGHGVAFADWDRDGDVDLFVGAGGATPGDQAHNLLFQNPGHGHHWLTLKLVGTKANRSGLGARVRVDSTSPGGASVARHRVVGGTSSYGGNPTIGTIGLGPAKRVATLEVRWPGSGTLQTFHDLAVDQSIEITEGQDAIRTLDAAPIAAESRP